MNMKAIKFFKYILPAVLPLAFTACQEEYTPGEQDRWDCQGLFFPQDQQTEFIISPSENHVLTFVAQRAETDYEAEVPYVLTASEEDIFTMEDDYIYFEEDQATTTFKVTVGGDYELGKKYTCSIKVTDPEYVSLYGLSSNELSFSVTVVEWKRITNNGVDTGMWRDDLFTSFGQQLGADLEEPYAEKQVAVYERSDMPAYFKVEKVYTPDYVSQIYAGDDSYADQLVEYCPGSDIYINATNPDKVYIETQFGFYDPFGNYGAVYFCSDVAENFDAGYSNLYGTFKNGVVEFKTKNSIVLYLPSAGVALGNLSGKTRLVLPGHKGYDYSVALDTLNFKEVDGKNVLPLKFTVGADVKKVKYQVFEGNLSNVELVSKLEEVKTSKDSKEVTASTVLDFTAPKTNFYTLVACSFAEGDVYQEYDCLRFGYDTKEDPRDVDIHMGLIVSDKHGATGRTKENSMEFYIYGSDIIEAKVAVYKTVNYKDFESSIDSLVRFYMPGMDAFQLDSLNRVGYTGLIDGLAAGVEYTMVAYADNGYRSGIFTTTASTEGEYNPLDEQFQFYDMPKALQATEQEDYFKEWDLWSVDPFTTKDWTRTNRGKVSFAEGEDLLFNSNGDPVYDIGKADASKTMQVISLSGMFPNVKKAYDMESDAIDFHYYEGYVYSLMTMMDKTKVDGKDAYPTNAYLYYNLQSGGLSPFLENFAMIGGFVRNPVDLESRDIIAFTANPTASADYLAMCLCWFEDEKYTSNGYLFEEEAHAYPILINPDSKYTKEDIEKAIARKPSHATVSRMIQAGQTNCVETADGFVKSTIDRFKALPYNYMENLTDVKVSIDKPVAEYSVTESSAKNGPSAPVKKLSFVERILR